MAYPATNLPNDQQDPPYGGQPANRFGTPALQYYDGIIQFLEAAYLAYTRQPYQQIVTIAQDAGQPGDGVLFDSTAVALNLGYTVRRISVVAPVNDTKIVIGCYVKSVSALSRAQIAVSGIVPAAITGLASGLGPAEVTFDTTTGRLRVKNSTDPTHGYADPQGNVLLLPTARIG